MAQAVADRLAIDPDGCQRIVEREAGRDAAPLDRIAAPFSGVQWHRQAVGVLAADPDDHVGARQVVDVGDVLVAYAPDVVLTRTVAQEGRAFGCLDGHDASPGFLFEVLTACQCAADTRGGHMVRQSGPSLTAAHRVEQFLQRCARWFPNSQLPGRGSG